MAVPLDLFTAVCLTTLSITQTLISNDSIIVNNELEMIWEESRLAWSR
jgi:hypothetical protein